jgi:hypothetical protein
LAEAPHLYFLAKKDQQLLRLSSCAADLALVNFYTISCTDYKGLLGFGMALGKTSNG